MERFEDGLQENRVQLHMVSDIVRQKQSRLYDSLAMTHNGECELPEYKRITDKGLDYGAG